MWQSIYPTDQRGYIMIRHPSRAASVLLATLALPLAVLAVPLPASAATPHLCERYDPTVYCVGSASLDLYTSVTERDPGRDLTQVSLGGTFENAPTYSLEFSDDLSECVGVSNDIVKVEVRTCGAVGTVWARVSEGSDLYAWINRYATQNNDQGQILYLSGLGNGSAYEVEPLPTFGWYQKFDWQS